jgi:hypothetical protein
MGLVMSQKSEKKLTMAEFMAQLLVQVGALNNNLQNIAKMVEILQRIEKAQEDFYAKAIEKGVRTKAA